MRMLQQVFREFSMDWILHCTVKVFSMDTDMDMDMWTWSWTCKMDIDTAGTQRIMFCTWGDAVIERAMSYQC